MSKLLVHKSQERDIDTIVSIENHNDNAQFIIPNSKMEHLSLLADKNIGHFVLKSGSEKIIGFFIIAGLKNKNRSLEFRRIVIKEKGKGYGRMAIKAVKKYCFEEWNGHRLWLDVLKENISARYLYQSEGFKEEGELRDCLFLNGKFRSLVIMSILEGEYQKGSSKILCFPM